MTQQKSPYEKGHADGYARKPGPPFPTSQSCWADRLYARGWSDGVDQSRKDGEEQSR